MKTKDLLRFVICTGSFKFYGHATLLRRAWILWKVILEYSYKNVLICQFFFFGVLMEPINPPGTLPFYSEQLRPNHSDHSGS